ncbi:TetR/AcrR family transcriptional regulator [soil metagenome]
MEAAVEVLHADGLAGLSIEAVATRSGVAKSTIYRQFRDREELHFAALQSVVVAPELPFSDDLVADVTAFCCGLNRHLRDGVAGSVLPTAMDGAERSESLAALVHEFGVQRRIGLISRLRAAQKAGELDADADLDLLISQLVGPVFFRRFISRQPASANFVTRHVAVLLNPLVRPSVASRGRDARSRLSR